MDNIFQVIKNYNIDDKYLSEIGFDINKKSQPCILHGGNNKTAFQLDLVNGTYTCHTHKCVNKSDIIEVCRIREGFETPLEAAKFLAAKYNIPLPTNKEFTKEEKRLYAIKKDFEIKKEKKLQEIDQEETNAVIEGNIAKVIELEKKKDEIQNEELFVFPELDYKNRPLKNWVNLKALLDYNHIEVIFNEISKNIEVKGFKYDDLESCIMDIHALVLRNNFALSPDFIGRCFNRISLDTTFNPVTDYLTEAYFNWDGKEGRVQQLCETLVIDSEEFSPKLRDSLVTKWLLNTVKIPFNSDGRLRTEGVLVIQGEQGIGKTRWIENIVPNELYKYLKTGVDIDPKDKDKVFQAIKYWLVELGELDSTMKAEQSKLKAFFTEKEDELRRPYAKNPSIYPRRTSFYGTVNKKEFLKDETGDRRYWVIPCIDILIDKVKEIDIDQLWGELMHLKDKGVPDYLTKEDQQLLKESNSEFRAKGKTQIAIESNFDWNACKSLWTFKSKTDIALRLNLNSTVGLNEVFSQLGIKETKGSITINGKASRPRGFKTPPYKNNFTETNWTLN